MELKHFNFILVIIALLLALNLFFPLAKFFNKIDYDNLSCNINGNGIKDIDLCCSEVAKFLKCDNGLCDNGDYKILSNENTLRYCKQRGYNVRY